MYFYIMLWESLKIIEKEIGDMLKEGMEDCQRFWQIVLGVWELKLELIRR